jgi:hypothetical protein
MLPSIHAAVAAQRRVGRFAGAAAAAAALTLFMPAAAVAAVPSVTTFPVFSTGATTVTVYGFVNPEGLTTTYRLQWDDAGSLWCSSDASSGSPAHTTAGTVLGDTDSGNHLASVELSGLVAGHGYCARLVATNSDGEGDGGLQAWTQGAPNAEISLSFSTGATTATIQGSVNPREQSTTYQVEWDLATSDWCKLGTGSPANATSATDLGFTDNDYHDVSVDLTGLAEHTNYCADLKATNTSGASEGNRSEWTQGAPTVRFPPPPCICQPPVPIQSGPTTASIGELVNPAGKATTYKAVYDLMNSQWCQSNGFSGTPAHATAYSVLGSTGSSFVAAGIQLTGLTTGTAYCAALVATNSDGTSPAAGTLAWTQVPYRTLAVSKVGSGSGTVGGFAPPSLPAVIDCGPTCATTLPQGSQVRLVATASAGSTFAGWSGGGCSGTANCDLTLNSDTSVTATFTLKPPPTQCIVPRLKGKTVAAARRAIKSHHCSVGKITKFASSPQKKGKVVSQNPKPGKHLKRGAKVSLKVGN